MPELPDVEVYVEAALHRRRIACCRGCSRTTGHGVSRISKTGGKAGPEARLSGTRYFFFRTRGAFGAAGIAVFGAGATDFAVGVAAFLARDLRAAFGFCSGV